MSENLKAIEEHIKVKSIPALCFNKDDFVSNEFSVDKFVSDCRKYASLDTMRDNLNMYHKILCTAMIELLNKDYADFVNLSSSLAGLDKSIKSLSLPLKSLKNEIEETKCNLDDAFCFLTKIFSERSSVHASRVSVFHHLCFEENLEKMHKLNAENSFKNIDTLERMAFTFNSLQFHMNKTDSKKYSVKEEKVQNIGRNLELKLQSVFLQSLSNAASDNDHKKHLHKILRICSYISEERKLENAFQTSIVMPFMKNLITQNNIIKLGLKKILNDIINFIPNACNDLLKSTKNIDRNKEVFTGYDFLVNAIWPEIVDAFQYIAPVYLYSLGDPQKFHQNYSSVMEFLDEFEHLCEVQSSVMKLRAQPSYKEFIQKFNLDVYFQVRYQEIAGKLECDLFEDSFVKSDDEKLPYHLKATASLWNCLNLCWCDTIFLSFLKKDFWKLTVQLLLRFNKYVQCCLNKIKDETLQLAWLINDIEILVPELRRFFLQIAHTKLNYGSLNGCFEGAIRNMLDFLLEIPIVSANLIVKILSEKCTSHLKLISSIPQRFRKTNREIPSKPSPYVSLVLSPLTEFFSETSSILSLKWCKYCENEVTDGIMKQCIVLMEDVLTSIKKMEDSLKILKRARDKPTGLSNGAITDDDKIRRQLAIDVNYFEQLVLKSGMKVNDLAKFKELKELVTSAERNNNYC